MKTRATYWVIDDRERTWIYRERLKQYGCKWDVDHKAWTTEDPTETFKKWVISSGLALQFRKEEVADAHS